MISDDPMTWGQQMKMIEKAERKRTNGAHDANKGRKMYAKIIVVNSEYVDDLTEEIIKHSIPDEMKVWVKGVMHYAMLLYHNWEEPE